ncbi:hypothetical protein [Glaesserella sp.]|uniref:hypothetical protein n=1 Tax=Glaesserella sp. TaxID=2094731 RepID=UPI00359FA73A
MIKKLSIYMVLLFSVPLTTWLIGYRWEGEQIYFIDTFLLFLSELIEYPYTLFICIILMFWLMWLVRKQHSWILVGMICATSIISMHELKEASKNFFMEPRPYLHYFLKEDVNTFYQISSEKERFELIKSHALDRARSTEHGARSTEHGARSTEHGARSTEHGARSTEHGARSTEHGA